MPSLATGHVQMENICRGVVAVRGDGANFVSWRMFGYEPDTISYNVYRDGTKVNAQPITDSTNYLDAGAPAGAKYTVRAVLDGAEREDSEEVSTWAENYLDIQLDAPEGYTPGDASAGDLDGDGHYDLVVKWEDSPQDNSNAGTTNTVKLEGVKLDGTRLWLIDLGRNIREGAHYTQFLVYDLDGDGKSELVVKTAPGTVDGKGKNVILGDDDPNADYRNDDGYVLSGPEYLTVFSGLDGAELETVPFEIARGTVSSWGDNYGNRVDRFVGAVAFVTPDGRPSALMGRGYYTRSTITAWNWRDAALTKVWTSDSNADTNYTGQGSHGISIADVDGDLRQDIIYGASMIKADGTRGCTTDLGHGDSLHVGDLIPGRPGLEVFMPHESGSSLAYSLRDAKTCEIIFEGPGNGGNEGPGRGVAGDIDPLTPGAEYWTNSSQLLDENGQGVGSKPSSVNFLIWWDGDETRELLDGNHIDKFNGNRLLTADGCSSINGTKSTPNLSADLLGDWREEVIFRCGTNLRLYTTSAVTTRRIYTLMHDPQYRSAISWQQSEYNQPPHPSFHIGSGMAPPPKPDITVR
jgi:rhamnogalacturonan endolyase